MTSVPTICLDDLTEDQIRAYIIADNKLAELAGWNKEEVASIEQHLMTLDKVFDVTVTDLRSVRWISSSKERRRSESREEREAGARS